RCSPTDGNCSTNRLVSSYASRIKGQTIPVTLIRQSAHAELTMMHSRHSLYGGKTNAVTVRRDQMQLSELPPLEYSTWGTRGRIDRQRHLSVSNQSDDIDGFQLISSMQYRQDHGCDHDFQGR